MESQKGLKNCSECQRRKQKCSREWPCNHCQARKVPHLCKFGHKSIKYDHGGNSNIESKTQKRHLDDSQDDQYLPQEPQDDVEDGLKAWGYMPGHVHFKLGGVETEDDTRRHTSNSVSGQSPEVEKVLHIIPPRTIADTFINHFLTVVNNRYNAIYGPTFTDHYVEWWADRGSGKRLSPEFTCLLLRILAYSVQYLTPPLRKMIEFELACSSQALTERFGDAAEQLSATFPASKTNLERVQEQFFKGAWLKTESRIVESWHCLARTIREAQELGLDKDAGTEGLTEFDIEIRRRMFCLLYIWDWQMSAWLGRPHVIDQNDCSFTLPNLRLDSGSEPNLVSPFTHMALQAVLARRINQHTGSVPTSQNLSAEQVLAVEAECDKFFAELPPVFRLESPDLSLDDDHPYYVFQRRQLHVSLYMTKFNYFKPYLIRNPQSSQDYELRKRGVDLSLQLFDVSCKLFDYEYPINTKFHLVVFCLFDTATLLCSAIIHDTDKSLPRREEVMDSIYDTLHMLNQLSSTTKIAASSYNFLLKLVRASPELSRHGPNRKRQRICVDATPPPAITTREAPQLFEPGWVTELGSGSASTATEPAQWDIFPDDGTFDIDQFLQEIGDSSQIDIGGMEQIWDWEDLNLDTLNQDPVVMGA